MDRDGIVAISTEKRGECDLSDFLQLPGLEPDLRVIGLVPESVALPQPTKLFANDAAKSLADDRGRLAVGGEHRRFGEATSEEVNVGDVSAMKRVGSLYFKSKQ